MFKQPEFSFKLLLFIALTVLFYTKANSQNSTLFGIAGANQFVHIDAVTGQITEKSALDINFHDGTSTYDPAAKTYYIAGYRDTSFLLVSVDAPSGKVLKEQSLRSSQQYWYGFVFDNASGKIYGTRADSLSHKLYFMEIDPVNNAATTLSAIDNVFIASGVGASIDNKNRLYFFGGYGGSGFNLVTISLETGAKLHSVSVPLPTGNYHYDTVANQLYGITTSVPMAALLKLDYENGAHKGDSIPYLRTESFLGSWYTYDDINGQYIVPHLGKDHSYLLDIVQTGTVKVAHSVATENNRTVAELEYDAFAIDTNGGQLSGSLKTSAGTINNGATIYAAVKNASGEVDFTDSTLTDEGGNFTLNTQTKEFYVFIKPDKNTSPTEAPTWFPGTVNSNNAQIYSLKKGINMIDFSTKNVSSLSVEKNTELPSINIYPNPSNKEITITTNSPIHKIEIINTLGSRLISREVNITGSQAFELPDFLPAGMYFMKIYTKSGNITKAIIRSN